MAWPLGQRWRAKRIAQCGMEVLNAPWTAVAKSYMGWPMARNPLRLILLANSAKLFRAPEGRGILAGAEARAQAPGQTQRDFSRPCRDAGPEFPTETTRVRRPFRARGSLVTFPVVTLRSTTG
jgi:hypothetical protein